MLESLSDAVGELLGLEEQASTVETRTGRR